MNGDNIKVLIKFHDYFNPAMSKKEFLETI